MSRTGEIKVWDPLVRVFHWSLVAAFFLAFFTEDEWMDLHVAAGYTVLGLVLFRIVWGVIGPRHARFSDFVSKPSTVLAYLKDVLHLRPRRYIGHNPAGGAMIIVLLVSLSFTGLTGLAVYGAEEGAGPLAVLFTGTDGFWGEVLEEVHEFLADFTLLLVFVHVAGVILESLIHRENLVQAMITGRKRA